MSFWIYYIKNKIPKTIFCKETIQHLKNPDYKNYEFLNFSYDDNSIYCTFKTGHSINFLMEEKEKYKQYFKEKIYPELVAKVYHPSQHDYWINYDEEDIDPFVSSLER